MTGLNLKKKEGLKSLGGGGSLGPNSLPVKSRKIKSIVPDLSEKIMPCMS